MNVDSTGSPARTIVKAATKGVIKVMSKMGISAIQSYHGAQVFEAVGLRQDVIDQYFTWTASRIGGVGHGRHRAGSADAPSRGVPGKRRPTGTRCRRAASINGVRTASFTCSIRSPSIACRKRCAPTTTPCTSRTRGSSTSRPRTWRRCAGCWISSRRKPVPIEEVEPVESIVKRFKTGAMSYGSISKEAHETLAIAMNRIGGKSNTGEGGEDPERYEPLPNGDSKNSAIKQVASGRFGVTSHYLVNAQELQIKMAQGAKPGEGGQIARQRRCIRGSPRRGTPRPGVGLISPPPHHDIYSIEDLAELIHDLKNGNRDARISVKLVAEVGVGTIAAGVAKAHADVVLISGHDGGTGASPQTSIAHAGLPWELGLAETHQTLVLNNLRSRIAVETDGQLKTGRDVVVAALLGAEEFGFATAPLVAVGCIMMRVCHLNTCPVGVATQDPRLREKFAGKPEHVVNFMHFIAQDMREIMAQLGFRTVEEMIGRVDRLMPKKAIDHWKAKGFDFSNILYQPDVGTGSRPLPPDRTGSRPRQGPGCHHAPRALQARHRARRAGARGAANPQRQSRGRHHYRQRNHPEIRTDGVCPSDTIHIHFKGSAGQSFGAFMPHGMTFLLEGDANDYLGKGLSGGKIIVFPPVGSTFVPEENIIIGNVGLYGATSGEVYICGMAGERFAVRNSGVDAVVEAVGDHGCEYMTGGHVVVLGPAGRNFGAGMSGGIAYVLDELGDFSARVNLQMVDIEALDDPEEIEKVHSNDRAPSRVHRQRPRPARARQLGRPCCRSLSASCRRTSSARSHR